LRACQTPSYLFADRSDASVHPEAFRAYRLCMSGAAEPDIAKLATAIADERRARMLLALNDGRALPAMRLAAEAGVAPSTASGHLSRLVDAGLLTVEPQGRYRCFRLASAEVGALIESMSQLAPPRVVRSLREATRAEALRGARTCYDHLAGRLGVSIFAALLETGSVVGNGNGDGGDLVYRLTGSGRRRLGDLAVELPAADEDGTTPVRYCVDWTEQRHHLSGIVGRALARRLFELHWIERLAQPRVVRVTPDGERGLERVFGAAAISG
jgi:DNA-binding transcriptional ArsR family regulator